ncbi:MAG: hypothetical protein ACREX8_21345 [Gammaproteobacteria bacterium]
MNTLLTGGGAPEWLRELATARTHYEEMFGWPVTIEVEQQVLAAPVGGVLDAVIMPAPLGEKVLADLQLMMLAGPVIARPDGASWMFFTQPVTGPRREVPAELCHLQVHLIPRGTHVVIPTQVDSDSGLWWIKQPQPPHSLPPWSVVIGVTRRVAAQLIGSGPAVSEPAVSSAPAVSTVPEATDEHRVLIAS